MYTKIIESSYFTKNTRGNFMRIHIKKIEENDKSIIPAFEMEVKLTGIYTDMIRTQLILDQLSKIGYTYRMNEGHYPLLTVEETFRFYMGLGDCTIPLHEMLTLFRLKDERKTKVKHLSESAKNCLSFLRSYLFTKELLVIEEPFDRLDEEYQRNIIRLIKRMVDKDISILLLSNNLEELLLVTEDIYRLDQSGFHQLDFKEDQDEIAVVTEEPIIKIEKIQTKHQDKTILFNPPEIDYIESMEGKVYVNVAGTSYSCAYTLQELEMRLQAYGFYRCHRSYIVNLQKVREIITWTKNSYSLKLNVQDGVIIPLSRARIKELKELIGIL